MGRASDVGPNMSRREPNMSRREEVRDRSAKDMPSPIAIWWLVRLLRSRAAAIVEGEPALEHMNTLIAGHPVGPELPDACDRLFGLMETSLGRPLVPECCCSARLSADEAAAATLCSSAGDLAVPHLIAAKSETEAAPADAVCAVNAALLVSSGVSETPKTRAHGDASMIARNRAALAPA